MPMVMPQQYMMAVRLPAGMPPPTHGQPIMAGAAGVQGMQAMQGFQVSARTQEGYVDCSLSTVFSKIFRHHKICCNQSKIGREILPQRNGS